MFRKGKDKELDVTSLNEIIHTGKKFVNIAYFMTIIAIVLLGTYILKEVSTKDDEILYQMVEDDVEFAAIAKVFSELTDEDTAVEY